MNKKVKTQLRKEHTRQVMAKKREGKTVNRLSLSIDDNYYNTTKAASHYEYNNMFNWQEDINY